MFHCASAWKPGKRPKVQRLIFQEPVSQTARVFQESHKKTSFGSLAWPRTRRGHDQTHAVQPAAGRGAESNQRRFALPPPPRRARVGSPRAAAELLRPPARRAHDFGRSPSARTDGTKLVSRCLRVGGMPCECVVGRGRREMCVCVRVSRPGYPPRGGRRRAGAPAHDEASSALFRRTRRARDSVERVPSAFGCGILGQCAPGGADPGCRQLARCQCFRLLGGELGGRCIGGVRRRPGPSAGRLCASRRVARAQLAHCWGPN